LSPSFVDGFITNTTNARAAAERAGSKTFKDWAPFDTKVVYKMMGLLFVNANAVSPKPQLKFWFLRRKQSRIFGNDYFTDALDKKLLGGRVTFGGSWRCMTSVTTPR
jgi:hypothetical protein